MPSLFDTRAGDPVRRMIPIDHTPWTLDVVHLRVLAPDGRLVHHATRVVEEMAGTPRSVASLRAIGRALQALHANVPLADFLAMTQVMEG